ncbi:MAG: ATP-binding protein [candidate division WOR-3 bacterium]
MIGRVQTWVMAGTTDRPRLAENQEVYRLLDDLLEGVWIEDPAGKIVFANARLVSMCGYDSASDLIGQHRAVLTSLDDPRLIEPLDSADSRFTCETLVRTNRGTAFTALLGMTPLVTSGGGYQGRLCTVIDLRERKRLENEVRRCETRFRDLIEGAPDGIAIVVDNTLRFHNRRLEEMTRYGRDELRRLPFTRLIVQREQSGITDVLDPQRRFLLPARHEVRLIGANGSAADVELRIIPIEYEGRSAQLCFFRDIRHEKELNRMKTEFVAMISHELRTPLAMIKEAISLLSEGREAVRLEGAPLKFLSIAQDEINRLNRMVDNLLEISRMEAVAVRLRIGPVRLAELIDRVVGGLQVQLRQKNVRIEKQLPEALVTVHADEDRIYQVMANILDNAVKFSPQDSVVTVKVENVAPGAAVLTNQGLPDNVSYVQITVSDQGPGVAPEFTERIFQKFERAEQSPVGPKGIGLGLAIARSIVELHGGRIWVESELGKGSHFAFLLPSRPPENHRS